jgi:hypothetical protein
MEYFKKLGFYSLTVVDAVINMVASIFGSYPCVDLATSYLVTLETSKVNKIRQDTEYRREKQRLEADNKISEAKDLLDV